MRPYLRAVALIVVATTATVLADPVHRLTTLRVALLALVLTGVVALVQGASRRLPPPPSSPFDPARPLPPHELVPVDLARLASDLELYAGGAGPRLGTGAADRTVRALAIAQLARGQVDADDDLLDDPAALALLGPATRAALARRGAAEPPAVDPRLLVAELEER